MTPNRFIRIEREDDRTQFREIPDDFAGDVEMPDGIIRVDGIRKKVTEKLLPLDRADIKGVRKESNLIGVTPGFVRLKQNMKCVYRVGMVNAEPPRDSDEKLVEIMRVIAEVDKK